MCVAVSGQKTMLPHNSHRCLFACTKFATCLLHYIVSDLWNLYLSVHTQCVRLSVHTWSYLYVRMVHMYARTHSLYARTDSIMLKLFEGFQPFCPWMVGRKIVDSFHPGYDLLQAILKICVRIGFSCFLDPFRTHPLPHQCNWIRGHSEVVSIKFRVWAIILKNIEKIHK